MFFLYSSIILIGILLSGSQSQDTDNCTMIGTKKLCVQREVIGVRGEDVILSCRFIHHEGNKITNLNLYWIKYYNNNNRYNFIFMSSPKYTHESFKGRIQTVGNPSEGDGTVRIRDLKMEDEGTYKCWFEFTERKGRRGSWSSASFDASDGKQTRLRVDGSQINDRYNCTMEGTKKLCVQRDVIGVRGEDVILPCRFNHDEGDNIKDLSFVLYRYYNSQYNVIFNSSTNDTDGGFKGRIQIVGNPNEGDGSVRIGDLNMEDEGTYVCRFEFYEWRSWWSSWHHVGLRAREGKQTRVRVDVLAKILKVSKEFKDSSNSWRMFCEAEAKPRPNITWLNPNGHPVNGTKTISSPNGQKGLKNTISIFNITGEDPEGKYTCLVENKYGQAQDHVIFTTVPAPQSNGSSQWIVVGCSIALSFVLLLLFAVGLHIYRKKRNHSEGMQVEKEPQILTTATPLTTFFHELPASLKGIPNGNSTQPNVELHESGQRDETSYMVLKKKHHDESQSQVYDTL